MLEKLTYADFSPHINSTFKLIHLETEGSIDIQLVEAEERNTEQTDCFTLIFKGPKDEVFVQNTHKLVHGEMGEVDLFIAPVLYGRDDGTYYQVIFNRLKR